MAPHPPSLAQVAAARPRYRLLTGRDLRPERVDPADPGVEALFRGFLRRAPPLVLGAHEGEWLALAAGIKPVVREILTPRDLRRSAARWEQAGLRWAVVGDGVEGSDQGFLRGGGERRVVYVGPDGARVREAAEVGLSELRDADDRTLATCKVEQGRLLGYPPCCARAFAGLGNLRDNRSAVAAAAARSRSFDPRLANTALSIYHHVSWFPCRYDCPESVGLAQRVEAELLRRRPGAAGAVQALGRGPRVVVSDRLQLLLDGDWDRGSFHVRSARTPWAHDGRDDDLLMEWLFYADLGAELLRQGRIEPRLNGWGRALWLPFGGGAEAVPAP